MAFVIAARPTMRRNVPQFPGPVPPERPADRAKDPTNLCTSESAAFGAHGLHIQNEGGTHVR